MGRRGSFLTLIIITVIVTLVVIFAAIQVLSLAGIEVVLLNAGQPTSQVVITVPVLITATQDTSQTEEVRIVTTTPLPGTPGVVSLPTGLIEDLNGTTVAAPTINPSLIGEAGTLQASGTALPANCILHTIEEGEFPSSIAEQYGANLDDLMAVNGLTEESATFLQIGDTLIVPLEGCPLIAQAQATEEPTAGPTDTPAPTGQASASPTVRPTASPIPTATLPPTATNAQVEIVRVLSPGDINAEGVDIRNNGAVVDLTGWKLSNNSGVSYTFPQQRLFTGSVLTVYTRVGTDTPTAKFWGRDTALWSSGATLTLTDGDGRASPRSSFREGVMSLIDEQIKDAMRKGQFEICQAWVNRSGWTTIRTRRNTCAWRTKSCATTTYVPDWMAQGRELDAGREKLIADMQRMARRGNARSRGPGRCAEAWRQKA